MKAFKSVVLLMVLGIPAGVMSANNGKLLYESRCIGCHQLGRHAYGPDHCGLAGRHAGTATGYTYTKAMINSDIVWGQKTLDRFLQSPQMVIQGTGMTIKGVKDEAERKAIITYLLQISQSSTCM